MSTISIQTRKFADLTEITSAPDSAMLIIHDGNGVKKISTKNLKADIKALIDTAQNTLNQITYPGAAHNRTFRGKNLGSSVTSAQWAAIKAGTFDDLYIGDYWTINGVNWRIAAFNYYLHVGDTECTVNHVTIVPDTALYNAQMNTSNVVTGAYVGSAMYTSNLASAKSIINSAFGSGHILNHRSLFANAATNGYESGIAWRDSTVELMTEQNLYGGEIFTDRIQGTNWATHHTVDKSQYPLFAIDPTKINIRADYWLRNVANSTNFAFCSASGQADGDYGASTSFGVRPAFSIYQS